MLVCSHLKILNFLTNFLMAFQVFQCKEQKCGHFYHPGCVAKILYPDNKAKATCFEQCVAGGLEFSCPVHKCKRCKEAENKHDKEMQFAVCRRCPTVYHRKCLPRFAFALPSSTRSLMLCPIAENKNFRSSPLFVFQGYFLDRGRGRGYSAKGMGWHST